MKSVSHKRHPSPDGREDVEGWGRKQKGWDPLPCIVYGTTAVYTRPQKFLRTRREEASGSSAKRYEYFIMISVTFQIRKIASACTSQATGSCG
jgi:hypothetical protein